MTSGLVCEFNPLHKGHLFLIEQMKKESEAVVCVMSGNFTQRGEATLWDKFARAKTAVLAGADLVLELPVYYAVNGAFEFAKGGVRILKGLNCIDKLFFGSETGDAASLKKSAASFLLQKNLIDEDIKSFLAKGFSYPAALEKASILRDVFLPSTPNDILGLEYIKNSLIEKANWDFCAVKRRGAKHFEEEEKEGFASASYIRNLILKGEDVKALLPSCSFELLENYLDQKAFDEYFQLLRYKILISSKEKLAKTLEIAEGLENKLKTEICFANNLEELLFSLKSKRYTYSRLCRIMTQILLGLTKDEYEKIQKEPLYAKVLAFNKKGAKILKNSQITVISNVNKSYNSLLLNADLRASDIYNILSKKSIAQNSDKTRIPKLFILNDKNKSVSPKP